MACGACSCSAAAAASASARPASGRFRHDPSGHGRADHDMAGTDNFGPAWSSVSFNQYTNAPPGFEYLAFARGVEPACPA